MAPFTSILCGIDFSEHSRHALRAAAAIALRSGARLHLVHVIDLLLAEAATTAYDESGMRAEAEADLRRFAAPVCADPSIEPTFEIRVGRADREILHAAEEQGASAIVVGTHGLGGFRKLFFGSVTERLLRRAMTPVLAVPLDESRRAATAPTPITSVLAAVDLDETALPMALAARQIATALGVPLTLVHAVPSVQASGRWTSAYQQQLPQRLARASTSLRQIAQVVNGPSYADVIVRSGAPAEEIADVASSMPGLLIVVGLGGGWMLHRPGSTAYRVLCLSTAPVLALPSEAVSALASHVHRPATTHA